MSATLETCLRWRKSLLDDHLTRCISEIFFTKLARSLSVLYHYLIGLFVILSRQCLLSTFLLKYIIILKILFKTNLKILCIDSLGDEKALRLRLWNSSPCIQHRLKIALSTLFSIPFESQNMCVHTLGTPLYAPRRSRTRARAMTAKAGVCVDKVAWYAKREQRCRRSWRECRGSTLLFLESR